LTVLQWDDKISTLLPPSSRGPGRGPFKAKTGVRIPVGALQRRAREGTSFFFVDRRRRTADHCRTGFPAYRGSGPSTNGERINEYRRRTADVRPRNVQWTVDSDRGGFLSSLSGGKPSTNRERINEYRRRTADVRPRNVQWTVDSGRWQGRFSFQPVGGKPE
jgi:hypothetical protein